MIRNVLCARSALAVIVLSASACGGGDATQWQGPASTGPGASAISTAAPSPLPVQDPYTVSRRGGTPATGPGRRFNSCERIWCSTHRENFFIDHFRGGHTGWILHEDSLGDLFVPQKRTEGPAYPNARPTALYLCGTHMHPYILGKYGGPIRHTGFNLTLGYSRSHFNLFGTRLDTCCENGLGSGFIHSSAGRQFRFHDLDEYRAHPEMGWQKPFVSHPSRTIAAR